MHLAYCSRRTKLFLTESMMFNLPALGTFSSIILGVALWRERKVVRSGFDLMGWYQHLVLKMGVQEGD